MSTEAVILLVEDNPTDVILVRRAFEKARIANPLIIVSDGDAAVNYLAGIDGYSDRSRFPLPALVLLDLKLPRRSGLEVLEWIRAQPGIGRVPVVVLTSSSQRVDVDRAYDVGANSYLVKPVEYDAFEQMLRDLNAYWMVRNTKPTLMNS